MTAVEARKAYQYAVGDAEDGNIKDWSIRDLHKRDKEYIQEAQKVLNVTPDGVVGPKTLAALTLLASLPDEAPWPPDANNWHLVKASSFADPADVRAFQRCKDQGGSDQACFKVGDNGIGRWGDDCSEGSGPRCALPPEDWEQFKDARGKKLEVQVNGRTVVCELRDTMPHKANITNGAGIDLNPDACAALGLTPPVMVSAQWRWI